MEIFQKNNDKNDETIRQRNTLWVHRLRIGGSPPAPKTRKSDAGDIPPQNGTVTRNDDEKGRPISIQGRHPQISNHDSSWYFVVLVLIASAILSLVHTLCGNHRRTPDFADAFGSTQGGRQLFVLEKEEFKLCGFAAPVLERTLLGAFICVFILAYTVYISVFKLVDQFISRTVPRVSKCE
mmetsp:Transcript_1312/g.1388  ORF Transcript_1312/g.1388 Transcript_1312/m.1388 type:complete len:181 (+) Transcript_1312:179-721(+)